ncbi:unnamed protein product [Darwinula stevensoni]|uniref:Retinol dehydrogenase 12 n=1 Tax=Darwinula stevensoni TaxID=69355 RepID=A0A7R9AEJ0_9CRUS|nr:unnamed protein product [Darwinula stevensoni]CAG0901641.1 unnamed protein product [Darwinula stevensoni]
MILSRFASRHFCVEGEASHRMKSTAHGQEKILDPQVCRSDFNGSELYEDYEDGASLKGAKKSGELDYSPQGLLISSMALEAFEKPGQKLREITSKMMWLVVRALLLLLLIIKLYMKLSSRRCRCRGRLDGKTALVTGGTHGIGKATVAELARRGARVLIACQDFCSGRKVAEEIKRETGNSEVFALHCDLSSLESVRTCAETILRTEKHLHLLINNAAVAIPRDERVLTGDGLEQHMAVNHFGHFLLTHLLLELLKKSQPSRIVNVSSLAHLFGKIEFDNLNSERKYHRYRIYGDTKLANALFTMELSRRLKGTGVTANCCHPGGTVTKVARNVVNFDPLFWVGRFFLKSSVEGAQTTVHLCLSEKLENVSGKYFIECREAWMSSRAKDPAVAKKLWERSEYLVGLAN